jgi:phage recombination protein Bet
VDLIKRTIAKGATDDELQLFLWVAKRHRLDPFTRQLHLVKRWSTELNQDVATIQIGIDGYRQMASRYPDFGSVSEAEYEMGQKLPVWARVRVFKKGIGEPSVGVAYWEEYAPELSNKKAFMWKKMPRHMLAKCAEAIALRKAYPDLADIYTDEEMSRTNSEVTDGGRQIVEVLSKSEQSWEQREQEGIQKLTPEQREVVKTKMAAASHPVDCLFYKFIPESETYLIDGAQALKQAHRELLKPLWSATAGAIVATPSDLGRLISRFEDLKVPFRELKADA